jgi:Ice-binding-like
MKIPTTRRAHSLVAAGRSAVALAIVGLLFAFGSNAVAATAVGLGTAGSYAVLAGTGITNTGPTTITGDIGTFPNTPITGVTSLTLSATNHAGDRVTRARRLISSPRTPRPPGRGQPPQSRQTWSANPQTRRLPRSAGGPGATRRVRHLRRLDYETSLPGHRKRRHPCRHASGSRAYGNCQHPIGRCRRGGQGP